jgi:hypothetical protein
MKFIKNRKLWLRIGVGVVLVLGTLEAIYWSRRIADDRRQAEADSRIARIIAQASETRDYKQAREQVVAGHFDLATIKRAINEEIHRQTIKRVDGYFEQKTPQQRTAYLDRVIDEAVTYQKFRSSSRPTTLTPATAPSPQGKGAFLAWISQQPAVTRARLAEFGAAFNARLAQRGLPRIDPPVQ